ncbi:PhzF family phenazine biosynthesis protein [Marinilabilia rubra]|uniref:Isomerase n=1 Tax=Marinilabilia rubra TaxID=2162893 RepID=A0A2U2B4B7_9BACT|nr:PhzF family phenazine biosynthesis protein [Marinilabilia rubra]PWD97912.1 isomerase [Marinilabilia rubra]
MRLKLFQVDAFTDNVFGGNPAAVVPLEKWLADADLQKIAMENNLSETGFFVPEKEGGFHIRWFTPEVEVNLCGHATLATSHVIFNHLEWPGFELEFKSRSGLLKVRRESGLLKLNFPTDKPKEVEYNEKLADCFDKKPLAVLKGSADYLMIFDDEEYVRNVIPNLEAIKKLDAEGVIISAKGKSGADFVSRFFAPQLGIPEDPVTGSAHTVLVPYWAQITGKKQMIARQLSQRGGELFCADNDDRVELGGKAVTFLEGEINF